MTRKAQVTLFIIVGLVLLLGVILGVAIYKNVLQFRPPEEQVIAEVPTELKPLAFAIEECQQSLLDEASRKLLATGGYLDPQAAGVIATLPPAGTGTSAGQGSPIAYWHHLQDGAEQSERPSLIGGEQSIAGQLARYVDERLDSCVPWSEFPQYEITKNEPDSTITFDPDRTRITTAWDVTVETQLGTTELDRFQATVDAPIERLYNAAEELTKQLRESQAPEHLTMEWLAIYAIGSENDLPPLYKGLEATNDIEFWMLESAKPDLKQVLQLMADSLEVMQSRDWSLTLTDDEEINQLYNKGLFYLGENLEQTAFSASLPLQEDVYWTVNDNRGVAIPQTFEQPPFARMFSPPLVDYSFYYDLAYPLALRFEQDGYTLNAAYEVNIEDNQPADAKALDQAQAGEYCTNPGGTQLTLTTEPRITAPATYTCGEVVCPIGEVTDGRLQTTLPSCANGRVQVHAEDRFASPEQVSSDAGETADVRMRLYEPRETDVTIERYGLVEKDGEWVRTDNTFVTDAQAILVRHGTPHAVRTTGGPVQLVPGTYDVYVVEIEEFDPPHKIPEQISCPGGVSGALIQSQCIGLTQTTGANAATGGKAYRECITNAGCGYYNATNFSSLPMTYLELSGDRAVTIESVPDELTINAVGYDISQLQTWDDIGLLSALFDVADAMRPEEAVETR